MRRTGRPPVELSVAAYDEREQRDGRGDMRQLEQLMMLRAVDNRWIRHLTDLDELREGIGLRAIAQQDPLWPTRRKRTRCTRSLFLHLA
jgi:preprotein translocase subunit SecA